MNQNIKTLLANLWSVGRFAGLSTSPVAIKDVIHAAIADETGTMWKIIGESIANIVSQQLRGASTLRKIFSFDHTLPLDIHGWTLWTSISHKTQNFYLDPETTTDRAMTAAFSDLLDLEDKHLIRMLDRHENILRVPVDNMDGQDFVKDVVDLCEDIKAGTLLINRQQLSHLIIHSKDLDPVISREANINGYVGRIKNVDVVVASGLLGSVESVPRNVAYLIPDQNLSRYNMTILSAVPTNIFNRVPMEKGWDFQMSLQFAINNDITVYKLEGPTSGN